MCVCVFGVTYSDKFFSFRIESRSIGCGDWKHVMHVRLQQASAVQCTLYAISVEYPKKETRSRPEYCHFIHLIFFHEMPNANRRHLAQFNCITTEAKSKVSRSVSHWKHPG